MHIIIYQPVISEKSIQQSGVNKYAFKVDSRANATMIKIAIEKLFKVNVLSVNTLCVKGKPKKHQRTKVKRADWKKAVVTLKPGQTIKLFEERKTSENAN